MSKILFIDTNVFLHYHQFDQINWAKLLDTEMVLIIIPPVTLRELNEHKDSHRLSHIRERAQKTIKILENCLKPGMDIKINKNLAIRFEDREPNIDYDEYQLNRKIQDDNLIASMLMYRNENIETQIILVTRDSGLLLCAKAGRQSIQTLRMPDDHILSVHPDPAQVIIQELTKEIQEYKNSIPDVFLLFENGEKYNEFKIPKPLHKTSMDFQNKLDEIKQKFPKINKPRVNETELIDVENSGDLVSRLAYSLESGGGISQDEYDRYNNELEKYYKKYSNYLVEDLNFVNLRRRTVTLDILLTNNGTAPANDIDVIMHFPDGLRIIEEEDLPEPPSKPKPPVQPRNYIEMITYPYESMVRYPIISTQNDIGPIGPSSNISSFDIKRTNSYEVNLHVNKAKHNMQEHFEPLYIIFNSYKEASSFEIKYKFIAANIPREVSGSLHVIINKN